MVRTSRTQAGQVVEVAEVLEGLAVAGPRDLGPLLLGLGQERGGLGRLTLAEPDRGLQEQPHARPSGWPRNSGRRPSVKKSWRACSARISWRNMDDARASICGSWWPSASRWLSARSRSPAKQSSSARNSRRPASVGCACRPRRAAAAIGAPLSSAGREQFVGVHGWSTPLRSERLEDRASPGRVADSRPVTPVGRGCQLGRELHRREHLVELEMGPQVDHAVVAARLVRAARGPATLASRSGYLAFTSGPALSLAVVYFASQLAQVILAVLGAVQSSRSCRG